MITIDNMIGNVSRKVGPYITRNIRASQFLGDETATMGTREDTPVQTMRGHPLFALTADREREREEGGGIGENDASTWTRVNETQRGAKCRECGL